VPNLRLLFTQHAEQMLVERRIDRAWVEATIRNPDALEADPTRPGVFRAFGRIAERDGRFLRVVYAPGETIRILTVFFDRKRKR
jgi:hypothetical protein